MGLEKSSEQIVTEVTEETAYRHETRTSFLVHGFRTGKRAGFISDAPIRCRSSDTARRTGVVAFATSGDAESGDDQQSRITTIISGFGRLSVPLEEA